MQTLLNPLNEILNQVPDCMTIAEVRQTIIDRLDYPKEIIDDLVFVCPNGTVLRETDWIGIYLASIQAVAATIH
jgi:hypothetical protein